MDLLVIFLVFIFFSILSAIGEIERNTIYKYRIKKDDQGRLIKNEYGEYTFIKQKNSGRVRVSIWD